MFLSSLVDDVFRRLIHWRDANQLPLSNTRPFSALEHLWLLIRHRLFRWVSELFFLDFVIQIVFLLVLFFVFSYPRYCFVFYPRFDFSLNPRHLRMTSSILCLFFYYLDISRPCELKLIIHIFNLLHTQQQQHQISRVIYLTCFTHNNNNIV